MFDPLTSKAKVVLYTGLAFLMGLGVASGMGWTDVSLAMPAVDEAPQVSAEAVAPARELSEAFIEIADVVTPAVVRIEATRSGRSARQVPDVFQRFFGPEGMPEQQPRPQIGGGSGFIISDDGYILTNDHVVGDASAIRVYLTDRRYFDAELVGTDPFTDVAVIKIDTPESLPTLSFGDSDAVRVGEWVMAVGNPGFGTGNTLDYTVTAGIVSARGRGLGLINRELQQELSDPQLSNYAIEDFIQTDAVINPGNSGGPMVDLQGRVIGINSAIASATGFYQGYGFAIPVNLARRVMEDLVEYGTVRRPRLGVTITNVTPEDAEYYGLPSVSGAKVEEVPQGTPADEAGIRPQDVIVAVDGKSVGYSNQLQQRVAEFRPGDRVTITLYRDGERREVEARLGEAPISEVATRPDPAEPAMEERLGITVDEVTPEMARQYGWDSTDGVIITNVAPASPAARRGLGRGLRILAINDRPVNEPADVGEILSDVSAGDVVNFQVLLPSGQQQFLNIRMPAN